MNISSTFITSWFFFFYVQFKIRKLTWSMCLRMYRLQGLDKAKKKYWVVENKRKNRPISLGELEVALNTPQCDCLAKGLGKGEEIWDRHTVSSMFSILHLCSYLQHLFHSYLCMDVSYVSIFLMCFFFFLNHLNHS